MTTESGLVCVLSAGLGIESTSVLVRWCLEPASCPVPLDQVVVCTAMTGEEYDSTRELWDTSILPILREHRIRYVQLARSGQSDSAGITVLDDSRDPQRMIMRGPWRLGDEYAAGGTVVQQAGSRTCSIKAKGWVIDRWLASEFGDQPYLHAIGFNRDETSRILRDSACYGSGSRRPIYPLAEDWNWSRADAAQYLRDTLGITPLRSNCTFCPYANNSKGAAEFLARWAAEEQATARALILERSALALNPKARMFGSVAAHTLAEEHGLHEALADAQTALNAMPWAVYEVRRLFRARGGDPTAKGQVWRSLLIHDAGTRRQAEVALTRRSAAMSAPLETGEHDIIRAWVRRTDGTYPSGDHFLVAAPKLAVEKQRTSFDKAWQELIVNPQPTLFPAQALLAAAA